MVHKLGTHIVTFRSNGDFLSRDIKYHKSCQTANWRKYIQAKERVSSKGSSLQDENSVAYVYAEIEFFAELQETLDQGDILTLTEVSKHYTNMMSDHGLPNKEITRAALLIKIEQQIGLGEGHEPTEAVMRGCEEFLCSMFCPSGVSIGQAKRLRWCLFKQLKDEEGVDKLPPTQGAWVEHIRRAHIQCHMWLQDLVLNPSSLDPLSMGWKIQDNKYLPILSQIPPAPDAVLQLVRCTCEKSQCSKRCSCRSNNVVCTELCKCGRDVDNCMNIEPPVIGEDLEND